MATHIDDWVDDYRQDKYARWFFLLKRLPANLQVDLAEWIHPHKLFCQYHGETYRVTGASRLGDIQLTRDFQREAGYDLRVAVDECSDWKSEP